MAFGVFNIAYEVQYVYLRNINTHRTQCVLEHEAKEQKEYFGSSICFNVGKGPASIGGPIKKTRKYSYI